MELIKGTTIWDLSRVEDRVEAEINRIEFPSLIFFKGYWYCSFREGAIHNCHPSGRGRVIRSADGQKWDTVVLLDWDSGDVREPKLSITAEGWLMANTQVYFVSKEARPRQAKSSAGTPLSFTPSDAKRADDTPDRYYQLDWLGTVLNLPADDSEQNVTCQSVTWLSSDGITWSNAYACPTGINSWRWDAVWHNGMGYSLAQWGKDLRGPLYRTRDGKSWRVLQEACVPEGKCNEGALAFGENGAAYCLLRESKGALFGSAPGPYYQDWTWKRPTIDYGAPYQDLPATDVLRTSLGGPKLLRLKDGRLVGAGRALGPEREDGRATVFWIDPENATLKVFFECDGTSYPGLWEHEGKLWISYIGSACHRGQWEIHLAQVEIPPKENLS